MHYFTWKLEQVPDILWFIVEKQDVQISTIQKTILKSNVLEEIKSCDDSELEYESMAESFGGFFFREDSSKQLQVTSTV